MIPHFAFPSSRRELTIAAIVLVGGGFAAHAGLIALDQQRVRAERTGPRAAVPGATGFHTPGADGAAVAGATGTTALPNLPLPAGALALAGDTSIRPAAPFSLGAASAETRARAQQCLTTAIYYEAASESDDGQRAVAQVILNRVRHPAFPSSVCGVIYQGTERGTGCQFSYACDGAMARRPSVAGWTRAGRNAALALSGLVFAPVGLATHYHTYAVTPYWNRSLVMTAAIGAHFFQRWQGGWGTPAAFHQRYAGIEPLPGPHSSTVAAVGTGTDLSAVTMSPLAPAPSVPPTNIQPAYADSGQAKAAMPKSTTFGASPAAATEKAPNALPETTMLDKWQGTGRMVREPGK